MLKHRGRSTGFRSCCLPANLTVLIYWCTDSLTYHCARYMVWGHAVPLPWRFRGWRHLPPFGPPWLCAVIVARAHPQLENPPLSLQLWYSAWALQCVWLNISQWNTDPTVSPPHPFSRLWFHHFFPSDPALEILFDFDFDLDFSFIYLSLSLYLSTVCLEYNRCSGSCHYKAKAPLCSMQRL